MCPVLHHLGTEPEADQSHGGATPQGDRGVDEGEGEGRAMSRLARMGHIHPSGRVLGAGTLTSNCVLELESAVGQSSVLITSTERSPSSALVFTHRGRRQAKRKERGAEGGRGCPGARGT